MQLWEDTFEIERANRARKVLLETKYTIRTPFLFRTNLYQIFRVEHKADNRQASDRHEGIKLTGRKAFDCRWQTFDRQAGGYAGRQEGIDRHSTCRRADIPQTGRQADMKAGSQTDIRQTGRLIYRQACSHPIDRHTDKHIGNHFGRIPLRQADNRQASDRHEGIKLTGRKAFDCRWQTFDRQAGGYAGRQEGIDRHSTCRRADIPQTGRQADMKAGSQTDIRQTGRLIYRQACSHPIDRHTDKHIGNHFGRIPLRQADNRQASDRHEGIKLTGRKAFDCRWQTFDRQAGGYAGRQEGIDRHSTCRRADIPQTGRQADMKAGSQTDIRQTGRLIYRQACSHPIDRHTDKHIGNQWVDVKLCRDAVGGEYLELVERQRKTRTSATDEGRTVPPRILSYDPEVRDAVAVCVKVLGNRAIVSSPYPGQVKAKEDEHRCNKKTSTWTPKAGLDQWLDTYIQAKEEWTKYGPLRDTSFNSSPTGRRVANDDTLLSV
ncbi:hypothetical protein DPMN_129695 [Dreissena polymorpha]|uniref:Uncharacterized protein n=1 Tax=Dreissena polymorpha TaxID=45954 RepID=A0A9D4H362_DREPO|nr:hypothetical protein DPMN_129695 [Dreissena polymorpha]